MWSAGNIACFQFSVHEEFIIDSGNHKSALVNKESKSKLKGSTSWEKVKTAKDSKKEPAKTMKEKKAAKREKKNEKMNHTFLESLHS